MNKIVVIFAMTLLTGLFSCRQNQKTHAPAKADAGDVLSFHSRLLVDSARYWWAVTIDDITGDDLMDVVFIDNNSSGGFLGYHIGQREEGLWELVKIAEKTPGGGDFASGDLECGDMDGDGDQDVLAVEHTGEWDDAGAPAKIYWYRNPDWHPTFIGEVPDAVKDLSLADFNGDGKLDLAVLTFDESTLSVFRQDDDGSFTRVVYLHVNNLHEGMDVGDLDGDGDPDIAATGYCFLNPGGDLGTEWPYESIAEKWHSQEGDWSRNATKHACADLDGDGKAEVFISHSERNGYPVAWYKREEGAWKEHVICDSLSSCHTLQVYDFDLDGDLDVLAGVNAHRALNIGKTEFPVMVYLNDGSHMNWIPFEMGKGGIYNGRVADFEGDGDFDVFRLPGHEARQYFLLENLTN
jgi:hypothetical protein